MHSNVVKSKCLQDCRLELIGHQGIESNEKADKCAVIVSLLGEITADNIIQTTLITAAKKMTGSYNLSICNRHLYQDYFKGREKEMIYVGTIRTKKNYVLRNFFYVTILPYKDAYCNSSTCRVFPIIFNDECIFYTQ